MKSRSQKFYEYEDKYGHIPDDYNSRLEWLYDDLKLNQKKMEQILDARSEIINNLKYTDIKIVLFEEPEGSPRPRARFVNRYNATNMAMTNGHFIKIYSITGEADRRHMRRLIDTGELDQVNQLLYTPCNVEYITYHKTPSSFTVAQKFLAEIGLQRPLSKPDWDNIGKKYSDMMNGNVWLDDTLVVDGTVRKFYSVKPRIEINLSFANILYNRQQYKSTVDKLTKLGISTESIYYLM